MLHVLIAGLPERVPQYLATLQTIGIAAAASVDPEDPLGYDGLLLPGGGDVDPALFGQEDHGSRQIERELDEAQLGLLDLFVKAGKPVLGICKGCQVLNIGLGGDVIQDLDTAAFHTYDGDFKFHTAFFTPGTGLYRLYGPHARVNSAHHQGVGRLGEGLVVAARAPDGVVEAIEHERLPLLGVQFHPERMCFASYRPEAADGAPIFRAFKALLEANV